MATAPNVQCKRLGIYSCLSPYQAETPQYIISMVTELKQQVAKLFVVIGSQCSPQVRDYLSSQADSVIAAGNDVAADDTAYQKAMLTIGWDELGQYDEVACLSDNVMPVQAVATVFDTMSSRKLDFWGVAAVTDERRNFGGTHDAFIPGYWQVFGRRMLQDSRFREYWGKMPVWQSNMHAERVHEWMFTRKFAEAGFKWDAFVPRDKYEGMSANPLIYMAKQVIESGDSPVMLRSLFGKDYSELIDQTVGQPALDLYEYLREDTDYDTDQIWEAVLPVFNLADLRKAMHLDYVLPTTTLLPDAATLPNAAVVYHVYFMDLLDDTFRYISAVPNEVDVFVTTTKDKIPAIRDYMSEHAISRHVEFLEVLNRGRDVSALLVAANPVIQSGKYDVVGFMHDKKSSQVQDSGHQGTESQGFAYKTMENNLPSEPYVRNVLSLFSSNPRLGLVTPPPPYHAIYFAHTRPVDWGPDYDITKTLLEDRLHIRVPISAQKATVSAIGSCYWFRVEALKPLFDLGWKYEDFLPEGQMGVDGTISHGIERANSFICQSRGYYAAWILSDRYARIELTSMFDSTDTLLTALGPQRHGETLHETCVALEKRPLPSRIVHGMGRGVHRGLQKCAKLIIQPLPKSVRDAIYNGAWTVINKLRGH